MKLVGLLVLFAFTTIWSGAEVLQSRTTRQIVSNVAHLMMAIVMVLMIFGNLWHSFIDVVPVQVVVGFFVAAVVWFHWLGVDALRGDAGQRTQAAHFYGHAAMMGAMAWHLIAMAIKMGHASHHSPMATTPTVGSALWIAALVGVPFMAYLLAASVLYLREVIRTAHRSSSRTAHTVPQLVGMGSSTQFEDETVGCHEPRRVGSAVHLMSALSGFAMCFGMFWMSTGLLIPILPVMHYLTF